MNVNQKFEIETSGSLMKKEFVSVTQNVTIEEAIVKLREQVKIQNNVYYMYIVNDFNKLIGVLTIRELLAADSDEKIADVMIKDIITIPLNEDQEDVARVFRDTDLVSMPVVNEAG
ncbi:MAG TPA: CBS domain-containing protein, partial [Pseudogracilibacillus sp.]|nr:CBS domain-containing protein [Pseudogracilibacillus sp.]